MSAHTPGPWSTIEHSWAQASIYAGDVWVSTLTVDESEVEDDKQEARQAIMIANARLISAAPDLLAAAQAFVAYCRNAGLNVQPGSPADKARSAIAKATGSAQ